MEESIKFLKQELSPQLPTPLGRAKNIPSTQKKKREEMKWVKGELRDNNIPHQ